VPILTPVRGLSRGNQRLPVYSDVPDRAAQLLGIPEAAPFLERAPADAGVAAVLRGVHGAGAVLRSEHSPPNWPVCSVAGRVGKSQFEALGALARTDIALPDGLACIAVTGVGLRGFHGRGWEAAEGNLHLTVHLAPRRPIERFESVFLALAAVAAVDAIDSVPGLRGRAGIRWVNDLVIDGAKVGGVLARTQSRGDVVTGVILGIGLNVEALPDVAPTAFVPSAGSLRGFAPKPADVRLPAVLGSLLDALASRYEGLLIHGFGPLLARYRERSTVLGRRVRVSEDVADEVPRIFASGRVRAIGDGLELLLDGVDRPVRRGRLVASDDLQSRSALAPAPAAIAAGPVPEPANR
jgi:BirA family transcriptional regulator, biotin operon repressor / biotin---[acetyl-CoA-carboxylase] ligase